MPDPPGPDGWTRLSAEVAAVPRDARFVALVLEPNSADGEVTWWDDASMSGNIHAANTAGAAGEIRLDTMPAAPKRFTVADEPTGP